ncbi:hypothetical protein P154DRAFT_262191 [Amniculicola lignicola CBS 123094]|uniref:F-box domain-containing protein n=1 Tax=Amniculicola lignicola CBS 123094 TaxID=1392246 RepID=A0A6A5WAY6_9PLEO|nr:hypothetical protein P154DRAFT_262191 [Amniculicola lignicola CBS 123094]
MAPAFLTLPLELREMIYEQLFASYMVFHGFGTSFLPSSPMTNRLAILQTCSQIKNEAWRFLPQNITFHFRGTEAMLETLMSVDQAVVTRIRYVTVKGFPFPLYAQGRPQYYTSYYFHNALSLLPGLMLEELVVEDCYHGFGLVDGWRDVVTYFDIEGVLKSDAWKTFVYVSPNTEFITSGYDHRKQRLAQPENWDYMLKDRDGEESGAEVKMFITPYLKGGAVTNVREEKQETIPWKAIPGHEVVEDWRLGTPEQELKGEVKIVARRGKKVGVVQKGLKEKRTWKEIKSNPGELRKDDWTPYYNDMSDAAGWVYGGWGRRMQLANRALSHD